MGSREPAREDVQAWVKKIGANVSAGTLAEAARFGELVVLATRWSGTEQAIRLADPDNLAGKVVIDVTNPWEFGPHGPTLAVGHTDSGGERVQRWLPQARVVKAFNIVGAHLMVSPLDVPGGPPDMFICGNDAGAKHVVTGILTAFGWQVVDVGTIEEARLIEPLGLLWLKQVMRTQNGQQAFKLLRK